MSIDLAALSEMKRMRRSGNSIAHPNTMAKRLRLRGFKCNVVQALGAMLRALPAYRRWVNSRAKASESNEQDDKT